MTILDRSLAASIAAASAIGIGSLAVSIGEAGASVLARANCQREARLALLSDAHCAERPAPAISAPIGY